MASRIDSPLANGPERFTVRGYEGFRRGVFGNAGQNLYVSRAGALQRIHQFDLNRNGHFDLLFCNSQDHNENPPCYVYINPLGQCRRADLPSDGARTGIVADLNGNGYDDLVLGMHYNGIRFDLNARIYYGSAQGFSESRIQYLPAPDCTAVTAGDFNGDGRCDLAFVTGGRLRIFYQSPQGFEPQRYVDLDIAGQQLAAADLDGDGCVDLIVRRKDGSVAIYWGGPAGVAADQVTNLTIPIDPVRAATAAQRQIAEYAEFVEDAPPLVSVLHLRGAPHVAVLRRAAVHLTPFTPARQPGPALVVDCPGAVAAAVGRFRPGPGEDLVFACSESQGGQECAWVYWSSDEGYCPQRKTRLSTSRACDVAVGDLCGNGCDDILICQANDGESFSTRSLIYRTGPDGIVPDPLELASEDARRGFIPRVPQGQAPLIVLVNHFSRNLLGNVPATIYWGARTGYRADACQHIEAWGAVEATAADLNDDGWVDLVLANAAENSVSRDPGSYIYWGGPRGFADHPDLKLPTRRAHGLACADIDQDGYLDLLFCGFKNPDITIFYGGPDGYSPDRVKTIRIENAGQVYDEARWIYLADLNNNGWLDLIVPQIVGDRSFILWGGPAGYSMDNCQVLSVVRGACARAVDLNGNGYLDLVIGGHVPALDQPHDSFLYIYWNGPGGLHEDNRTLLPAAGVNSLAIADFNNDGLLDIFVGSYHDGKSRDIDSFIYWQRPGGGFRAADRTRLPTHSASGCVAADFNDDGYIDLAVANHKIEGDHTGYSEIWWNGPDGFDKRRTTRLPTTGPHGMVSASPYNVATGGQEEYYISAPIALTHSPRQAALHWTADLPPQTWVKGQIRFAPTAEELAAAVWIGAGGPHTWVENGAAATAPPPACRSAQFRLALGAHNGLRTPRVEEVTLIYK